MSGYVGRLDVRGLDPRSGVTTSERQGHAEYQSTTRERSNQRGHDGGNEQAPCRTLAGNLRVARRAAIAASVATGPRASRNMATRAAVPRSSEKWEESRESLDELVDRTHLRRKVTHMKVLVAYDLGDASREALEQSRTEAKALGATLGICHVMPVMYEVEPFFSPFRQEASFDGAKVEADMRTTIENKVRESLGDQPAEVFVERGVPYAEIIRRAETWGADLVVVGSHDRKGIARALLGSVAERVVRHAHGSVLVARAIRTPGVVLAATDLSEASLPVVEAAARAAERRNARLVVLSAVDWSYAAWGSVAGAPFGATPVVPPPEVQAQIRAAMLETMQRELERVRATGSAEVLDGSPASAVAEYAEKHGAELIVVGTHGRTGFSRLALGSVAEHVVRSAGCSVLVVRQGSVPTTQPAS